MTTPDPAESLAEAARGLVYQTDTRGPKVAMCVERIRRELAAFDAARPVRECEAKIVEYMLKWHPDWPDSRALLAARKAKEGKP